MEVAHAWDPSGRTGITASWILREAMLTWWGRWQPVGRRDTREPRRASTRRRAYYEIAFDMNRKQEVDFLVHCFRTYARRPVKTVLDIACGTGPHLIRLAERGYRMSGLDLSPENIEFLRERAAAKGLDAELSSADMTRFRLPRPVDAAICMQDSQGHLLTNEALLAHLRCVARALRPGRALRLRPLHVLVVDRSRAALVVDAPARAARPSAPPSRRSRS